MGRPVRRKSSGASVSSAYGPDAKAVMRDGSALVMASGARFDGLCVKCGSRDELRPWSRTLSWHDPVHYLWFLFGAVPYFIAAYVCRRSAQVTLALCEGHRRLRLGAIISSVVGCAACIAVMFAAIGSERLGLFFIAMLCFFVIALGGVVIGRLITVRKVADDHAWIGGAAAKAIEDLPTLPRK